jgi:hypothetical protein
MIVLEKNGYFPPTLRPKADNMKKADYQEVIRTQEEYIIKSTGITGNHIPLDIWTNYTIKELKGYSNRLYHLIQNEKALIQAAIPTKPGIDNSNNKDYNVDSTSCSTTAGQVAKTTTEENTMTTQKSAAKAISIPQVKVALTKAGFTVDKDGIYTDAASISIKFNPKTIAVIHGNNSVQQTIHIDKATNSSFVKCILHLRKTGEILKHENQTTTKPEEVQKMTKPAVITNGADEKREVSGQKPELSPTTKTDLPGVKQDAKSAAQIKKEADKAAKAAKAKIVPVKPANPNKDGSTPTFDLLQKAVTKTLEAEETVVSIWQPIAEKYAFSVKGLIAELHAEGRWTDKKDTKGNLAHVDGLTVPAGYKSVYDAEVTNGLKGAGHFVNRAARMFTRLNPNSATRAAKPSTGPKASEQSATEQSADKIIEQLSKLAKKLSPQDLRSWLEADSSVVPVLESIIEDRSILSALD